MRGGEGGALLGSPPPLFVLGRGSPKMNTYGCKEGRLPHPPPPALSDASFFHLGHFVLFMAEINNKTGKKTQKAPIMIVINNDNNKEERGCLRSASGGEKSARKAAFASSREGAERGERN